MTVLAPCDSACSATAKPIPDEPPRITTRLFCKPFPCCIAFSFHCEGCVGFGMRSMHNNHEHHAFRETPPSRFEPSDYIRSHCGREQRYGGRVRAIAEPAGSVPAPPTRAP